MSAHGFKPGDRVYHPKWQTAATVVTIFDDESIGIKCDNAQFTETEVNVADVDQIAGQGDPAAPMAVLSSEGDWLFATESTRGKCCWCHKAPSGPSSYCSDKCAESAATHNDMVSLHQSESDL